MSAFARGDEARIHGAVDRALVERGFPSRDEEAELLVAFSVGTTSLSGRGRRRDTSYCVIEPGAKQTRAR